MMPAMRAVPSTSPFLASPRSTMSSVALLMTTRPSATAVRSVAGLAETSTMRASPLLPRCVRPGFSATALSCGAPAGIAPEQMAGGARDVVVPHQAFADEEGGDAGLCEPREIRRLRKPAFADRD